MAIDWAAAREAYKRDGAVHIPGLLNPEQLDAALKAWEWSLAHPTPMNAPRLKRDGTPLFYADSYNPNILDGYRTMLETSPIPGGHLRPPVGHGPGLVHL